MPEPSRTTKTQRRNKAVLFDERFTTQAARSALLEGRVRVRERRTVRDRIAAQIILQAYLDEAPADAGAS